jgi:hypothetical protein
MKLLENLRLFFEGAFSMKERSTHMIDAEADEHMDQFMLLCFADFLGVDLPTSYYALELLPHLAEEIEDWQKRMNQKESVWESRASALDFDP